MNKKRNNNICRNCFTNNSTNTLPKLNLKTNSDFSNKISIENFENEINSIFDSKSSTAIKSKGFLTTEKVFQKIPEKQQTDNVISNSLKKDVDGIFKEDVGSFLKGTGSFLKGTGSFLKDTGGFLKQTMYGDASASEIASDIALNLTLNVIGDVLQSVARRNK